MKVFVQNAMKIFILKLKRRSKKMLCENCKEELAQEEEEDDAENDDIDF